MTDPYAVPTAVLLDEQPELRKKIGWKVYFWFYLVFEIFGVASMFYGDDQPLWELASEILVYSLALTGLFAFAYNKKIAAPNLWRMVLLLLFCWDVYIFSSVFIEKTFADLETAIVLMVMIPIAGLVFLQYYALYLYAFQSSEIWHKRN